MMKVLKHGSGNELQTFFNYVWEVFKENILFEVLN